MVVLFENLVVKSMDKFKASRCFSKHYHEESKKQLVKVRLFKILFFIKGCFGPRILVLLVSLNWLMDKIWLLDIYNVSTTSSFYLEV